MWDSKLFPCSFIPIVSSNSPPNHFLLRGETTQNYATSGFKGVFYKLRRFWSYSLRMSRRENKDADEMRSSGFNMFILRLLKGIFSNFYYSRFDPC